MGRMVTSSDNPTEHVMTQSRADATSTSDNQVASQSRIDVTSTSDNPTDHMTSQSSTDVASTSDNPTEHMTSQSSTDVASTTDNPTNHVMVVRAELMWHEPVTTLLIMRWVVRWHPCNRGISHKTLT